MFPPDNHSINTNLKSESLFSLKKKKIPGRRWRRARGKIIWILFKGQHSSVFQLELNYFLWGFREGKASNRLGLFSLQGAHVWTAIGYQVYCDSPAGPKVVCTQSSAKGCQTYHPPSLPYYLPPTFFVFLWMDSYPMSPKAYFLREEHLGNRGSRHLCWF